MIVHNTLAVFGLAATQRSEWREELHQIRSQAMEEDAHELVSLLEAVIKLLDVKGNPAEFGMGLTGIYAQAWQTIIENLPT